MDAVKRDSTILQLCLTQSEKLVIYMNMYLLPQQRAEAFFLYKLWTKLCYRKLKRGDEGL